MPLGKVAMSEKTGRPVRLAAEGRVEWLPIGDTIGWGAIAAAGSDTELSDGTPVKAGQKAIEFGTVMVRLSAGTYAGQWVPFDSGGSNGAATLTRGDVGLLDMSIVNNEDYYEHTGLITGGLVWRERLKVGTGTQPSLTNLLAAMPRLELTPRQ